MSGAQEHVCKPEINPECRNHVAAQKRRLTVESGNYSDVCPLCGIHRQNAGFHKETCGDGYLKPDCFVKEAEPNV